MNLGESRQAVQAGLDKLQEAPVEALGKAWDQVGWNEGGIGPIKEQYKSLILALVSLKENGVADAEATGETVRDKAEAAQTRFRQVVGGGSANDAANDMVAHTETMRHEADTGVGYAGIMASELDVMINGLTSLAPNMQSMEAAIYRGRTSTDSVQEHAAAAITAAETCRDTL